MRSKPVMNFKIVQESTRYKWLKIKGKTFILQYFWHRLKILTMKTDSEWAFFLKLAFKCAEYVVENNYIHDLVIH